MINTDQPAVLLLHGWGGSFKSTWADNGWVKALQAKGRQVIAMDLPGHGRQVASHRPDDYADLVGKVAREVSGHARIDVIGYSLGAKLALALSALNPMQVRHRVVAGLGANVFAPERIGEQMAVVLENGVNADTPEMLKRFATYALSDGNDPLALAAVLRRPPNPIITAQTLACLGGRTLVIAGDQDATALPLEPLVDALPAAQRALLAGVDHLSLPANTEFQRQALAFLD